MNPLSNLIKMMDTRLNSNRNLGPSRNRMKNLQLNMSLVLEDASELNETRNNINTSSINIPSTITSDNLSPKSPKSPQQLTPLQFSVQQQTDLEPLKNPAQILQKQKTIPRDSNLKLLNKQIFTVQESRKEDDTNDILSFRQIEKDRIILQDDSDEDNKLKRSGVTSVRSSDQSSSNEDSPRSSDQSSSEEGEQEESKIKPKKKSLVKHSVRFSVMDVGNINTTPNYRKMTLKKLSMIQEIVLYQPLVYKFNVKIILKINPKDKNETYYECFEFSKRIISSNSALKILFKRKAQGHIGYMVELMTNTEDHVRARNRTSQIITYRAPGTPSSKKQRSFSPAQSPSFSSGQQVQFPNLNKSPLVSEFMQRAQQKVRTLKLAEIDMNKVLKSSSSSSSSSSSGGSAIRDRKRKVPIENTLDLSEIQKQLETKFVLQNQEQLIDESDLLPISQEQIQKSLSPTPPKKTKTFGSIFERVHAHGHDPEDKINVKIKKIELHDKNTADQDKRQLDTEQENNQDQESNQEQEQKTLPYMKNSNLFRRQLSGMSDVMNQIQEEDDSLSKKQKPSLMRRLPQIQLQDLSFNQKIQLNLIKQKDKLLFKLRPFLEDPDDQFDASNNSDRLSQKAMVKFKVLCTIGVGGLAFLLFILIISFISVSLKNHTV